MASTESLSLPSTPRRSISMPTPSTKSFTQRGNMFGSQGHQAILPLSNSTSPSSAAHNARTTARRISHTVKRRASRYAYPISISALLALGFLYYSFTSPSAAPWSDASPGKPQLYTRDAAGHRQENPFKKVEHEVHAKPAGRAKHADHADTNGVSFLTQNEDELIAEDDLFWQAYKEPVAPTAEEEAAIREMKAHRLDVQQHSKAHILQSLVWWLAEGGILPDDFQIPTKNVMMKKGGRGLEKMLDKVETESKGSDMFSAGWAEYTQKQYRVVVFSKSYCPFSKRAKKILEAYNLNPAPFIIEIDERSDMNALQTILQRTTGRRTVPNILIDFESIGGADDLALLHGEGGLQRKFEELELLPGYRRRQKAKVARPGAGVARFDDAAVKGGKGRKVKQAKPAAHAPVPEPEAAEPVTWDAQDADTDKVVPEQEDELVDGNVNKIEREAAAEAQNEAAAEILELKAKVADLEQLAAGIPEQVNVKKVESVEEVEEGADDEAVVDQPRRNAVKKVKAERPFKGGKQRARPGKVDV